MRLSIHNMSIDRLKWILLLVGMACVAVGWYQTYPLSPPMPGKYAIDEISKLVWPGLSVVFASLYLISRSGSRRVQFACAVVFTFFAYVHYLFFPLLPGSDAQAFRARTKLFSTVGVDPTQETYFQWPSFFILNNTLSYVLGLDVEGVSILVFLVIGLLLSSSLFIYFSREDERLGFVGVALSFIGLFWFINYQFAPQSMALALFFVLVNSTLKKTRDSGYWIYSFIVLSGLVTMHAFIATLFLLYYSLLVVRDRTQLNSLICFCLIYVGFLITSAIPHFTNLVRFTPLYLAFLEHGEYFDIVQRTFTGPVTMWDGLAQMFSRGLTVCVWGILAIGFLIRLLKRDIRIASLSMLLTGLSHLAIGTFAPVFGARSIQVLFIPIASGYKTFLNRNRKVVGLCLVLVLVLFPLDIVHEIYDAGSPNFLIETTSGQRVSDMLVRTIRTRGVVGTSLLSADHDNSYVTKSLPLGFDVRSVIPSSRTSGALLSGEYDYVIYSPLLEKELSYSGLNHLQIRQLKMQLTTKCNRVLDDGYSVLLSRD